MPQRVQAPDGTVVEFPDGMPDDQIAAAMAREYGQPESQKRDSISLGLLKPVATAAEKLAPYSPANLIPGFKDANAAATERLSARIAEREKAEKPNMFAEIASGIAATSWLPGGPVKLAAPFVQGAAQGYLLSDAEKPEGQAADAVMGGAINHFGGSAMRALGEGLAPVIDPVVKRLADYGLKPTPGMVKGEKAMRKEDRLMRKPVVGEAVAEGREAALASANTAAVNRALEPMGLRVPAAVRPGGPSVDWAGTEIGRAYDTIVPNLAVKLDGPSVAMRVMDAAKNLKPAERKQLVQIMNNELKKGALAGEELKAAQGEIRRLAGSFSRSQSPNDQMLGDALWAVDEELSTAMIAQNPKWAPELKKVNAAYRGYRIVADAASRSEGQIFTPSQLRQATRRGDFSKSKDASARGKAYMQDFADDLEAVVPARFSPPPPSINPFGFARGALDAVGYNADRVYQGFRMAPRPEAARRAGEAAKRLARPVGAAAAGALGSSFD